MDFQFVVVTLVALGGAGILVKRLLPARREPTAPGMPAKPVACAHCATGEVAIKRAESQTPSRVPTVPVVSMRDLRETARHTKH